MIALNGAATSGGPTMLAYPPSKAAGAFRHGLLTTYRPGSFVNNELLRRWAHPGPYNKKANMTETDSPLY
jgi:hypothetical protein